VHSELIASWSLHTGLIVIVDWSEEPCAPSDPLPAFDVIDAALAHPPSNWIDTFRTPATVHVGATDAYFVVTYA
jgi:hypothetical protein